MRVSTSADPIKPASYCLMIEQVGELALGENNNRR